MPDILVCIAFISTTCRLILECEAGIEIDGNVSSSNLPEDVTFRCWFSVGALKAQFIKQHRRLFTDSHDTLQPLSSANASQTQAVNLYNKEGTSVTGNLSVGVRYDIPSAGCEDAGVYRCTFKFSTVASSYIVEKQTVEESRLDLYPKHVTCNANPTAVDFATLHERPVTLRAQCYVKTTVSNPRWIWEWKKGSSWVRALQTRVTSRIYPKEQRCRWPIQSKLVYPVTTSDRNRQFRVFLDYTSGRSKMSFISLRDIGNGVPKGRNPKIRGSFKDALKATGWVAVSMLIIMVIVMTMVHVVYPAMIRALGLENFVQSRSGHAGWRGASGQGQGGHRRRQQEEANAGNAATGTGGRQRQSRQGTGGTETDRDNDDGVDLHPPAQDSPLLSGAPSSGTAEISLAVSDCAGAESTMFGSLSLSRQLQPLDESGAEERHKDGNGDDNDHDVFDDATASAGVVLTNNAGVGQTGPPRTALPGTSRDSAVVTDPPVSAATGRERPDPSPLSGDPRRSRENSGEGRNLPQTSTNSLRVFVSDLATRVSRAASSSGRKK